MIDRVTVTLNYGICHRVFCWHNDKGKKKITLSKDASLWSCDICTVINKIKMGFIYRKLCIQESVMQSAFYNKWLENDKKKSVIRIHKSVIE